MEIRLVVERGGQRRVCRVESSEAILGRARGNTVRIPSAQVSREHCKLETEYGLVHVEDLESVNGTFLNGSRIDRRELVRPGDRLGVGPVVFVVEYELTPEALERLREQPVGGFSVLQGLADGEVLEDVELAADFEMLDGDEEEAPIALASDAPRAKAADDDEPLEIDFDFDEPWAAPEGGELRDILSQLEDSEEQPPAKKQGRKKRS